MSNAAKHRKKAAEFEQLKQIDRAIASYIRSIEECESEGEEVDVALLNKVGDLALRQGRVSDAVTYYERAVEHYATSGLFNNAIALCNKILRSAPGRANVYFTLGRICAKKGLRGDATRNFLEYATRMQQEGRVEEGMRALAEVADLMPELTEVRRLVEEHATRAGIALPRKKTPVQSQQAQEPARIPRPNDKSNELVFLDLGPSVSTSRNTPPLAPKIPTPAQSMAAAVGRGKASSSGSSAAAGASSGASSASKSPGRGSKSLDEFLLFDPARPDAFRPRRVVPETEEPVPAVADLEPTSVGAESAAVETPSLLTAETDPSSTSDAPDVDVPVGLEVAFEPSEETAAVQPVADLLETVSEATPELAIDSVLDEPFAQVEIPEADSASEYSEPRIEAEPAALSYIEYAETPDEASLHTGVADGEYSALLDVAVEPDQASDAASIAAHALDDVHVEDDVDSVIDYQKTTYETESEPTEGLHATPREAEPEPFVIDTLEFEAVDSNDSIAEELVPNDLSAADRISEDLIIDDLISDDLISDDLIANESIAFEKVVGESTNEPSANESTPDVESADDLVWLDLETVPPEPVLEESLTAEPLTWLPPAESNDALPIIDDVVWFEPSFGDQLSEEDEASSDLAPLADLVAEDFESAADNPDAVTITGARAGTPPYSGVISRSLTPLDASPIPELEAAIEAGALAVARAEANPEVVLRRPPFRLDPHDFILPGELPPLVVDDRVVDEGLARMSASIQEASPVASSDASFVAENEPDQFDDAGFDESLDAQPLVTPAYSVAIDEELVEAAVGATTDEPATVDSSTVDSSTDERTTDERTTDERTTDERATDERATDEHATDEHATDERVLDEYAEQGHPLDLVADEAVDVLEAVVVEDAARKEDESIDIAESAEPSDVADEAVAEAELRLAVESSMRASSLPHEGEDERSTPVTPFEAKAVTPALPMAAVAAEASVVASSRRDELRAAVARAPQDFVLRRRLAEALFEVGEREAGLSELQATLSGLSQRGQLADASDIADQLVRISPDRIQYHQKRVELAVRLGTQSRLQTAYLDLADTLVRTGDEVRAHAVYARVLELDPWDERARTALGAAAPPPPPKPTSDSDFVNLADWLRDDVPATTRMRMPEPTVSGDEQADFDALLRHFKEGVSRSLGEDDFESHYDLGVAYKEMGLLDDAIAEFQKALRSRRHRLPAYEALGQCFVEQSRHSVAATVLTRALHEPGLGDEHRVGVLYLLAYSCEALQRWDEARSYYSRVYATDINFRDVAARLAALDQIAR